MKIKKLDRDIVQKKIDYEIEKNIKNEKSVADEGFNIYKRIKNDSIYKVQNTNTFFLDSNNYLFIIYSYGNNNFTSEMDIIIF